MIITLVKKESGFDFIKKMEEQYNSIEELEKLFERTNNMKFYVDLENWNYYKDNPTDTIEYSESLVSNEIKLSQLDLSILNVIKYEKPKSIRELALLLDKDVSNIQPRIHKLKDMGYIQLKNGNKNNKIPYLNYDLIKVEI